MSHFILRLFEVYFLSYFEFENLTIFEPFLIQNSSPGRRGNFCQELDKKMTSVWRKKRYARNPFSPCKAIKTHSFKLIPKCDIIKEMILGVRMHILNWIWSNMLTKTWSYESFSNPKPHSSWVEHSKKDHITLLQYAKIQKILTMRYVKLIGLSRIIICGPDSTERI